MPFFVFIMLWLWKSADTQALLFYWTSANLITLGQSAVFRLPFVRKALGLDYKGHALPPPPADAYVNPNPSVRETWQSIKDWQSNALEKARTQAAEQRARQAAEDERKRNVRAGTGKLAERVSEPGTGTAGTDGEQPLTRDEIRARRRAAMAARSKK